MLDLFFKHKCRVVSVLYWQDGLLGGLTIHFLHQALDLSCSFGTFKNLCEHFTMLKIKSDNVHPDLLKAVGQVLS